VRIRDFHWTAGEHLLSRYVSSSGTTRTFCSVCGSTLVSLFDANRATLGLALGTLDDDPGVRAQFHVFVDSGAPWFEITDDLPRYAALPPASVVRSDGSSGN
jgi:hypothetical protein